MLAELRITAGEPTRGLDELESGEGETCVRELVRLSLANGDKKRADAALDRALRSGCGTQDDCLGLYTWAASTEESRGNVARAISFWKRASDLSHESDAYILRVAELSARIGLAGEAIDAYRKLSMRHPEDGTWQIRADEIRAKSVQRHLPSVP